MAVDGDVCVGLLRHKTLLLREITDTNILDILVKKGLFSLSDHELITSASDSEKCKYFVHVVGKQSGVKLSELCAVLEQECPKLSKELMNDRHRFLINGYSPADSAKESMVMNHNLNRESPRSRRSISQCSCNSVSRRSSAAPSPMLLPPLNNTMEMYVEPVVEDIVCGDLLQVSQPAVSNIVSKISNLLAQRHSIYIKYPENIIAHRLEFTRLGHYGQNQGFQNIDGAIDCTHIRITNTPGMQHHEVYRNRKSYFSVNVQAVVGPTGQFIDMVARWAGSTHDSRIFQMSNVNMKYIEGVHTGKLVGDSGYPCLPYLLTPIHRATNTSEEIYNNVHAQTRNIVERTFGQWKRRFPCLRRGLGNKLSTVSNIIVGCAVLHNIGQRINDDPPTVDEGITAAAVESHQYDIDHNIGGSADGFAIRASIVNSYITM